MGDLQSKYEKFSDEQLYNKRNDLQREFESLNHTIQAYYMYPTDQQAYIARQQRVKEKIRAIDNVLEKRRRY